MTETFYGEWSVQVLSKNAWFDEQFTITGSDSSDGSYPGVPGTGPAVVSGQGWKLTMEWNDNAGSGWQPSGVRRSARSTVAEGLVINLGADDNYEHLRDGDFDDMVLICRNLDPSHYPFHPIVIPYDFTVSKEAMEKYQHRRKNKKSHQQLHEQQPHEPVTKYPNKG